MPWFFNSCYFHNVDFFHRGMPPLCPRNWEPNANLGEGHVKKIFQALRAGVCAPNFKTVSPPMPHIITVQRWKMVPITPTQKTAISVTLASPLIPLQCTQHKYWHVNSDGLYVGDWWAVTACRLACHAQDDARKQKGAVTPVDAWN